MKWKTTILGCLILFSFIFAVGCSSIDVSPTQQKDPTLPPVLEPVDIPDAKVAALDYLNSWAAGDYAHMYSLLTSLSQDAISEDEFSNHYRSITTEAALTDVAYEVLSVLTKPDLSQVHYSVTLTSILVGDVTRDTVMNLSLEQNEWRVQWDDTLVLPELQGGNYLLMEPGGCDLGWFISRSN